MATVLPYQNIAYADRFGYALKADRKTPIHIDDVNEENRHAGYYCLSCGEELTPVLGKERTHHFRHKVKDTNRECNYESYLHKLAKAILLNRFQNSQQFNIGITVKNTCQLYDKCEFHCPQQYLKTTNLKDYYDTVTEEGTVGNFRADVLLSCSDKSKNSNPTLLEINVTHPCTEEKINSKYRIIEFDIQNEQDACNLQTADITDQKNNIHFYNFKKEIPHDPITLHRVSLFKVENGFQRHSDSIDCMKIHTGEYQMLENSVYDVIYKCNLNEQERFDWLIALLVNNNTVKSCKYCKYYNNCKSIMLVRGSSTFDFVQFANRCRYFIKHCEWYLASKSVFRNVITHSATQQNPQ